MAAYAEISDAPDAVVERVTPTSPVVLGKV
jgi:hypothetical protein